MWPPCSSFAQRKFCSGKIQCHRQAGCCNSSRRAGARSPRITKHQFAITNESACSRHSCRSGSPLRRHVCTPPGEPQNRVHRILCSQAKRKHSFLLFPDSDFVSWKVCSQIFICPALRCSRWSARSPAGSMSWRPTNTPSKRATASTVMEIACCFVSA